MLEDRPSCIAVKKIWWQDDGQARLDVTLVTQLSVNRLQALEAQCKTWAGPVAAAVYLPLHNPGSSGSTELSASNRQKLQAAIAAVDDLVKSVAASAASKAGSSIGGCQLRIMLLYEVFAEERATALYPVNTLRNYARLMADTQLVANIDVDMLPSATLSRALLSPKGAGSTAALLEEIKRRNTAYVIPAFETTCGGPSLADQISQYEKPAVAEVISQGCLEQFREKVAPACHNATDFKRWFKMGVPGGEEEAAYPVTYQTHFEPWFISSRARTEWFDIRYRGYGKNKIQQVAHTAAQGTAFRVHPSGFLVHRPHTESAARKHFLRVKFKSRKDARLLEGSLFQHIESLWAKHEGEITNGTFKVMVDATLEGCLKALPWWQELNAITPSTVVAQ